MKTGLKRFWMMALLGCFAVAAGAQEQESEGMPADVYYLMPAFGQGVVYFEGQAPAQGKMNICAVDNSLRYLDKDGKELAATDIDNVLKVLIDGVVFLREDGAFYRLYPLSDEMGIALVRDVTIERDVKNEGFGTSSKTSATKEYGFVYVDGAVYNLDEARHYPYTVSETLYLYKGDDIYPFSKKGLRKLFPTRKADIDAFFKSGTKLPETVPDALELLAGWAQGE